MPNSKIVSAIGNIDGVNVRFFAGEPYTPGYTRYILNGRIHAPSSDDYSFAETNPDAGEITVTYAPEDGDVVQLFILDRRPTVIASVQTLVGAVHAHAPKLLGALTASQTSPLRGVLQTGSLQGTLRGALKTPQLQGVVKQGRVVGQLKKVC